MLWKSEKSVIYLYTKFNSEYFHVEITSIPIIAISVPTLPSVMKLKFRRSLQSNTFFNRSLSPDNTSYELLSNTSVATLSPNIRFPSSLLQFKIAAPSQWKYSKRPHAKVWFQYFVLSYDRSLQKRTRNTLLNNSSNSCQAWRSQCHSIITQSITFILNNYQFF